jgi:hypothetical protein
MTIPASTAISSKTSAFFMASPTTGAELIRTLAVTIAKREITIQERRSGGGA